MKVQAFPDRSVSIVATAVAVIATFYCAPAALQAQTPPTAIGPTPNARQIEWYHRERQAFFHFGMNTFTGLEWGTGNESDTIFKPTALDCSQWARTIKKAGFASAIIVAKHHDGFCLWPSAYTTHDVASSNWKAGKGDVVKELADACRAEGIKLGIYLSSGDFHHEPLLGDAYPAFYMNQTKELLKNYGTIWEIWWDGANSKMDISSFKNLTDTIHVLQPNAVIWGGPNAAFSDLELRWNGNEGGNNPDPCWSTTDRKIMDQYWGSGLINGPDYVPAEADVSIRPGWFYHSSQDGQVKSVAALWDLYFNSVGRNGGLLLSFPSDLRGLIHRTDSIRVDSLNNRVYGTFRTNLAAGATATSAHSRGTAYSPAMMIDTSESTCYSTPDANTTDTVIFTLGSAKTFDCLMLQEVIRLGHRTTGWSVDAYVNGTWTSVVANKQSIGYKWLAKFAPVTATQVRIRITAGKACPAIHTFGIYKQQAVKPPDPVAIAPRQEKTGATVQPIPFYLMGRQIALPGDFSGKTMTVAILDLKGRVLRQMTAKAGAGASLRNVHGRDHGIYLVKCCVGKNSTMQKVVNVK